MNPNDLATRYHLLNSSFKKTMIYHIGIDAGFFTEYTYMLHAMLYCLQHKIQFKLYSDDANFGWEKGWEDCFAPFCEQVHEPFHHTYNTHRLPSWQALMKDKKLPKTKLLKWKLKVTCKNIIGKTIAFFTYGKPVLLNFQLTFNIRTFNCNLAKVTALAAAIRFGLMLRICTSALILSYSLTVPC